MNSSKAKSSLSAAMRRVFPWLGRERHYASISTQTPAPKLEPISKTVAEAGRSAASAVD